MYSRLLSTILLLQLLATMVLFCGGCKSQFMQVRGLSRHQEKCGLYLKHLDEQVKLRRVVRDRLRAQALGVKENVVSLQCQVCGPAVSWWQLNLGVLVRGVTQ